MHTLRALTAGALALGSVAVAAPAAQAATAPVVSPLRDVNINLGLTQRVCATATGATGYEWRIWTAAKGWILLARGGTSYACINFTGEPVRHMGLIQVTAVNSGGRTASNKARLRVWGIARDYPATPGTAVRSSGWQITVSRSTFVAAGAGVQTTFTVQRISGTALAPDESFDPAYLRKLDQQVVTPSGVPCVAGRPDLFAVPRLAVGSAAVSGDVCFTDASTANTATNVVGGLVSVDLYPSATATAPTGTAWYRSN